MIIPGLCEQLPKRTVVAAVGIVPHPGGWGLTGTLIGIWRVPCWGWPGSRSWGWRRGQI